MSEDIGMRDRNISKVRERARETCLRKLYKARSEINALRLVFSEKGEVSRALAEIHMELDFVSSSLSRYAKQEVGRFDWRSGSKYKR